MKPTCIDLEERFGQRYRIGWEDHGSTKSLTPRDEWPWIRQIECRHGAVYPFGGEVLAGETLKGGRIGARLRALRETVSRPEVFRAFGDAEVTIRFHVDDLNLVLAILKPYRRRPALSEAQRAVLAAGRRPFPRRADVENDAETAPETTESLS